MTENNDYKDDEIIDVKLPRAEYELLKRMIKNQEGYNWLTNILKTNWLWVVGGGVVTIWVLFDKIVALFGVR